MNFQATILQSQHGSILLQHRAEIRLFDYLLKIKCL